MGRVHQSLCEQLETARALHDAAATRTLRAAIDAVEAGPQDMSADDERAVVRSQIAARARAASSIGASNPDAAAVLRREAEVLTMALAGADA